MNQSTIDKFMFVNKDNDALKKVLRSNYVDKTGLISVLNKSINSEYRFICVTRARRFGKSVTAQTINATIQKDAIQKLYFQIWKFLKRLILKLT